MRKLAICLLVLGGCGDVDGPALGERSSELGVDIVKRLQAIPGLSVYEHPELVPEDMEGYRYIRLYYTQRADHFRRSSPATFVQRITLLHRSDTAPVVLRITGYGINTDVPSLSEPAREVGANQFFVEHRGTHGSPLPSWETQTSAQAAADLHAYVQLFKDLYPGAPWISTGASKGGVEALLHRRLYPSDVHGTVAYVAPALRGFLDPSFLPFFETIPSERCRAAIEGYQRRALDEAAWRPGLRDELEALAPEMTFERLGTDRALASAVVAVGWAMFQLDGPEACDEVPAEDATAGEAADFLVEYGLFYLSDEGADRYEQWAYQSALELGYPDMPREHLADVLGYGQEIVFPVEWLPEGTAPVFSSKLLLDLDGWTSTQAKRVLLVYGEYDPWSWIQYEVPPASDSASFTAPESNHSATIGDLAAADAARALEMLTRWAAGG